MAKIVLYLPGNTFHANQLSPTMSDMDAARYGLPVFRKHKIPVTVSFQGVDFDIKPWLGDEMRIQGSSVDWCNAPFSHTLIPLIKSGWRDEFADIRGTLPVTFCPEFYVPKAEQIPTRFTFVLPGQSTLYSAIGFDSPMSRGDILVEQYPPDVPAISFQKKIGILLRDEWFSPFLKTFFLFQRFPHKGTHPEGNDCLEELIEEIRKIADGPRDRVVVVPIDIEAPWIGSHFGADVWEILFAEVRRRGYADVFTPLSAHLEQFAEEAVVTARPHRQLTKWTTWEVQLNHIVSLNMIQPENPREVELRMIASGSDIFAAWDIKCREAQGKKATRSMINREGKLDQMPFTYNQSVINAQLAAFRAIGCGRFLDELDVIKSPDYFIKLVRGMARQQEL